MSSDNSSHVGFETYDGNALTDVTAKEPASEFASSPQDIGAGWNDQTDGFVYEGLKYSQYDNGDTNGSIIEADPDTQSRHTIGTEPGYDGFFMVGGTPVPYSTQEYSVLPEPAGSDLVSGNGEGEMAFWEPPGRHHEREVDLGSACFLSSWVNSESVLCVGNANDRGVIRLATVPPGSSSGTIRDLVPPTDRGNAWPTASPDAKQFTFTSTQGDDTGLYLADLSGGTPHRVATLPAHAVILAWTSSGAQTSTPALHLTAQMPRPGQDVAQDLALQDFGSVVQYLAQAHGPELTGNEQSRLVALLGIDPAAIGASIAGATGSPEVWIDGERDTAICETPLYFAAQKYLLGGTHTVRVRTGGDGGPEASWKFTVHTSVSVLDTALDETSDSGSSSLAKRAARLLHISAKVVEHGLKTLGTAVQALAIPDAVCS